MQELFYRPQQIRDARRFFEILSSPNFTWFPAKPNTIKEERDYLRKTIQNTEHKLSLNFSILEEEKVIGAVGLKIDQHRPFIAEAGYFVDEAYWGRGIAGQALAWLEQLAVKELGILRMELRIQPDNLASVRVALKAKYEKEGLLRSAVMGVGGILVDVSLYAKVVSDRRY